MVPASLQEALGAVVESPLWRSLSPKRLYCNDKRLGNNFAALPFAD